MEANIGSQEDGDVLCMTEGCENEAVHEMMQTTQVGAGGLVIPRRLICQSCLDRQEAGETLRVKLDKGVEADYGDPTTTISGPG